MWPDLKGLVEKLGFKINIRDITFFSPTIIVHRPNNPEKLIIIQTPPRIELNSHAFSPEEAALFRQMVREEFHQGALEVMEEKSENRIEDITEKSKSITVRAILEYWKPKLSSAHFDALEAALYLREVFKHGDQHSIAALKKDIVQRFGPDGRNITNLCTSDYFDLGNYFSDVYEEMAKSPSLNPDQFQSYLKVMIDIHPFAIFVHREMSIEELSGEVTHKLQTHQKYGIASLAIHGIGKDNVDKIRKVTEEFEKDNSLQLRTTQEGNIILVRIYSNREPAFSLPR